MSASAWTVTSCSAVCEHDGCGWVALVRVDAGRRAAEHARKTGHAVKVCEDRTRLVTA